MNRDEERFIEQARASLEQGEADIPSRIAVRLRQVRHTAIVSRHRRVTPLWVPAMAAVMLVLFVGIAWYTGMSRVVEPVPLPVQQANDFEMLVYGEDLKLFADLDFYLWLEQRSDHAG